MREAVQNSFEATQVEGELTHHTCTHFWLVDISLEAIDKFIRMMGIFGWTARSGVSTMPATFAYCSACEEYSLRQQSIFCPLLTSALPVAKERSFSSRLRANSHIAGHKPSVLGGNPGDLEVDELPVTHCLWRWTKFLRRKIMVEEVKHEATAVLGPVHSSHSWYVETHEFPSA